MTALVRIPEPAEHDVSPRRVLVVDDCYHSACGAFPASRRKAPDAIADHRPGQQARRVKVRHHQGQLLVRGRHLKENGHGEPGGEGRAAAEAEGYDGARGGVQNSVGGCLAQGTDPCGAAKKSPKKPFMNGPCT